MHSAGSAPPPRIYVFAVRAVDAAGNVSPFVYRTVRILNAVDNRSAPAEPTFTTG